MDQEHAHGGHSFTTMAEDWDNKPGMAEYNAKVVSLVRASSGYRKNLRVFDYGCGTGSLLIALHKETRSAHGVDLSQGMITVARSKIAELPSKKSWKKLQVAVAKVDDGSDLKKNSQDVITMIGVLHHARDPETLLRNLRNALSSKGAVLMVEMEKKKKAVPDKSGAYTPGFKAYELERMCKRNGFTFTIEERFAFQSFNNFEMTCMFIVLKKTPSPSQAVRNRKAAKPVVVQTEEPVIVKKTEAPAVTPATVVETEPIAKWE
jgi:SAM-dependent methyltransferase